MNEKNVHVSNERDGSIDLLRVICALAVIIIHTVTAPAASYDGTLPSSFSNTLNTIHALANPAIPIFFMITGYCQMKKNECTYKYCLSRVLKFTAVLFTIGLAYVLLEEIYHARTFQIGMVLRAALSVTEGKCWDHMWFVYSIIGIYLVMPVLFAFFKNTADRKAEGLAIVALLFLFSVVFPEFESYFHIGVTLPFGGFLFYVCAGCLLSGMTVKKGLIAAAAAAAAISVVLIILNPLDRQFGYKSPEICLLAVSVFILVSRLHVNESALLTALASCTWGCYILHPLFINLALKVCKIDVLSSATGLRLCLFYFVITAVSFLTTYLLRKVPLIRKLF